MVLQGRDLRERVGGLKVFLAFCVANAEGQQALISGMRLPEPKEGQPIGMLAT